MKFINLEEMLVAADRDGNWKLHVAVAEELMPVFLEFDRFIDKFILIGTNP